MDEKDVVFYEEDILSKQKSTPMVNKKRTLTDFVSDKLGISRSGTTALLIVISIIFFIAAGLVYYFGNTNSVPQPWDRNVPINSPLPR